MIPLTNLSMDEIRKYVIPSVSNNIHIHSASNESNSIFVADNFIEEGFDPDYCSGIDDLMTRPYDLKKLRHYFPVVQFLSTADAVLSAVYRYDGYPPYTVIRVTNGNSAPGNATWIDGIKYSIPYIHIDVDIVKTLTIYKSLNTPILVYIQNMSGLGVTYSIQYKMYGGTYTLSSPPCPYPYDPLTFRMWLIGYVMPADNSPLFQPALDVINQWVDYMPMYP